MCEDHFDMEKDIANYMKFKMGFSKKLLLAEGTLPSKFSCQEDRKKRLCDVGTSRAAFVKRQKKDLLEECQKETQLQQEIEIGVESDDNIMIMKTIAELPKTQDKDTLTDSITTSEKSVQITMKMTPKIHYRSKSVQTVFSEKDKSTSPIKVLTKCISTSPFKIEPFVQNPSTSGVVRAFKKNILSEESDSDFSYIADTGGISTTTALSYSDSNVTEANMGIEKLQSLKNTLRVIHRKPLMYVGIPRECYFIIDLIHKHTNIKIEYILLSLKKIRLNSTFSEIEDDFGLSLSYASKLFLKNIPIIASVLRPFIVSLDKNLIKRNLPVAFRYNYYNVSCIIDCLEIDIQKPSKALHQALTWSEYKKGNTVKYLISCTPNGLVNYISPGFGGRTSDVIIVENCDFLNGLQQGTFILADRGFKHIEQILNEKGVGLLRPPTVKAGTKLSKAEVRQTKIIASLRIHIERVIRRLREFYMLKQHSVINSNLLRVLDDVIVIACALINLQDSLIK
ncbi:DDE superfamily endonuclease [Popillia japonica]|uniref:DDE superfamily endonuclease n=1 Tax=Popillia japonica TaxID=7064 RepID=A0AAW1LSW4_POPJA